MSKDEFVNRMLFMERIKKIRNGRNKDKELRYYYYEKCFERNKGKKKTYKMTYVNYDR